MDIRCEYIGENIRVEISDDGGNNLGVLYFERAKRVYNRKPVGMDGWVCVDARVGVELYEYTGKSPVEIIGMCYEEVRKMVGV
jgi:hypothetical protein